MTGEYHQITIMEYLQWKQEIKERLNATVDNFVVIGYRLKQIRDNEAYKSDGYDTMGAFVKAEYGLNEATASKFIKINDAYSTGGNSLELKEEYRGYGYNKLYEMIALPAEDRVLIGPESSVKDIRELKAFNRQQDTARTDQEEKIYQLYKELLAESREAAEKILDGSWKEDKETVLYLLAPTGNRMIRKGTLMLFLKDWETGVQLKIFGSGIEKKSYQELFDWMAETYQIGDIFPEPVKVEELEKDESETIFDVEKTVEGNVEETEGSQSDEEKEKVNERRDDDRETETGSGRKCGQEHNACDTGESEDRGADDVPNSGGDEPEQTEREYADEPCEKPGAGKNKKPEGKKTAGKEKTGKKTEIEKVMPEPVDRIMSRYAYMQSLSQSKLAEYIYNNMKPEHLTGDRKKIEEWLSDTVNEWGTIY